MLLQRDYGTVSAFTHILKAETMPTSCPQPAAPVCYPQSGHVAGPARPAQPAGREVREEPAALRGNVRDVTAQIDAGYDAFPASRSLNDRPGYLAVLECTDAGGAEIGIAITQMGYRPLFLLDPQLYRADVAVSLQNFECAVVDTTNSSDVLALLESMKATLVGVTSLVDSRIPIAAEVARKLDLFGPDPACIVLHDKAEVARFCPEVSPTTQVAGGPRSATATLADWQRSFGDSAVIVKPRMGCGAVGVRRLATSADRRAFMLATPDLDEWVVQEDVAGSLYSLEGWVGGSGLHFVGWTSRRRIANTETELRLEGIDALPHALTTQAKRAIMTLFDRACLRRGWFHIEFIVDDDHAGLRLIDANVGRTGGAMLPHVLAMALGVRPTELYQHAIETQLWGRSNVSVADSLRPKQIHKCICFCSPRAAMLRAVHLPHPLIRPETLRVTCILGPGDQVTAAGHDDWSWIGFVAGPEDEVDSYARDIRIQIDDMVVRAAF
jgi:hypothetical protein